MHNYDKNKNDEAMPLQQDLVDEIRVVAEQRLARYQDHMAKYYNSRVRYRDFQVGDLILRKVMARLGTLPKGSSIPIGKDLTKLHRGRGKTLTT